MTGGSAVADSAWSGDSPGVASDDAGESHFGRLLRDLRRRAGMSQQSLADTAGISVDAIAALERGRRRAPRAFTIKVLADALQLNEARAEELHRAAAGRVGLGAPMRGRLPTPTGPLVGRATDLKRVAALLTGRPERLVTLTGPGGIGKSRLGLQVAHDAAGSFPDGVRWLALEAMADSAQLPALIAGALGVHATSGDDLLVRSAHEIADRRVLLVLDSCEHLAAACAAACSVLLSQTTRLRIVATSRERLRLAGEVRWPVGPLEVPDDDCLPELLESYAATSLFLHHARQLNPTFAVSAADVPTLTRLCRRVDGLPLAVELAAARTAVMSVAEVARALDDGLDVLRSENRDRPARHRTMQSTLDWSYRLLSTPEQTVLARLSVFVDGATLQAAEAVCAGEGVAAREVVPLVEALAAKSLVTKQERAGVSRIGLLDTIRRYALDRLRASGEQAAVQTRHADSCGALAARAEAGLVGIGERQWLDVVDQEAGNLRRAVNFAAASGRAELALQLSGSLWRWYYLRGHYAEGRAVSEAALATPGEVLPATRAKALAGAAMLAFLQCNYPLARAELETSLELQRELGDRHGEAWMLQRLGAVAREEGRYDESEALHSESMRVLRDAGEPALADRELVYLVFVQWLRGAFDAAAGSALSALTAQRAAGSSEGISWGLANLGAISLYGGNLPHAASLLTESLLMADAVGFSEGIAWALNLLGVGALRENDLDRAADLLTESLERHRALGDEWRTASVLEALAQVSVCTGEVAAGARLLGAAAAVRRRIGTPVPACERPDHEETVRTARAVLGDASYESAHTLGAAIPLDRLVAAET